MSGTRGEHVLRSTIACCYIQLLASDRAHYSIMARQAV